MSIGRSIRGRLGRLEEPVSVFYRNRFVRLEAVADAISGDPPPARILEIGCGDGLMATALMDRFPSSTYQGIDIASRVGHLFKGDRNRATFESRSSGSLVAEAPEAFDLVLLVDVLHHVPAASRASVLEDVRALTAPNGRYALKDWLRKRSVGNVAAWFSDRVLTGDAVEYFGPTELQELVSPRFPHDRLVAERNIPPRPNNLLLIYQRSTD